MPCLIPPLAGATARRDVNPNWGRWGWEQISALSQAAGPEHRSSGGHGVAPSSWPRGIWPHKHRSTLWPLGDLGSPTQMSKQVLPHTHTRVKPEQWPLPETLLLTPLALLASTLADLSAACLSHQWGPGR